MQAKLSVEIIKLENEYQNAGYVNAGDLEAALNILEHKKILKDKLYEYSKVNVGTICD